MSSFRLSGLAPEPFAPLFRLSDRQLAARGIRRIIASAPLGYPCRVSLEDAAVGDELLLLSFEHLPGSSSLATSSAVSPYRAAGPIFVARGRSRGVAAVDEVPPYVARRLISLRAYDAHDTMVDASVCDGIDVGRRLSTVFDDAAVAFVHLHNAGRGCFSCRADRAAQDL